MTHDHRTRSGNSPEPPADQPSTWVLDEWLAFLRQHRGLEATTVARYRRYVEPFLQDLGEDAMPGRFADVPPRRVRDYLQRRTPRFGRVTRRHLVMALRPVVKNP